MWKMQAKLPVNCGLNYTDSQESHSNLQHCAQIYTDWQVNLLRRMKCTGINSFTPPNNT